MEQDTYVARTLESALTKAAKEFPAVLVTGPRQSGKTTILQHTFSDTHRFVSLDEPDVRALALSDPRLFLQQNPSPVVFDEIQYAPELLHYIKRDIDEHRKNKARYLLSGSQNLALMQNITETLAGRTAVLTLLSMSHSERHYHPEITPFWARLADLQNTTIPDSEARTAEEIMEEILQSGFPELVVEPERDSRIWFAAYLQTYLERDVRNMRSVGSLTDFQRFLQILGARVAQQINISDLARDIGIAVNTIKAWLSVLEATYQIVLVRPYFENMGKRLVKAPKLYFLDPGLPAYLCGLTDPGHALQGPMGGPLFENAVFAEIYRGFVHHAEPPRIYFWRTAAGHEVDFVLDFGTHLVPVEVKLNATPTPELAINLKEFNELFQNKVQEGLLVCLTSQARKLHKKITAIPFLNL